MTLAEPSRSSSPLSITLSAKLAVSTAIILIVACLLLGGLFIRQQVRSASESLVYSGTLLAQHLASMSRFSIVAGDRHRLNQLIQEMLAVRPVAYVAVVSSSGVLQAGLGKGVWNQQFPDQPEGQQQFVVTRLVPAHQLTAQMNEPFVSGLWLTTDGPVLRSTIELTTGELVALLRGSELPIFYDLLVQVPHPSHRARWDAALQLTLEEPVDTPDNDTSLKQSAPTFVHVGISTSSLQLALSQLLWQAVLMTVSILIGGLGIAILLARRMTIPLRALTTAATKLATGAAVPTVAVRTHDEIGTLAQVFNNMTLQLQSREHQLRDLAHTLEDHVAARTEELAEANAKLRDLDRRKSLFVSTASHELRTPLTSMKVHLANLRDGIDGAVTAEQRQSLVRVDANLSRLRTLIEELLDFSQIELGHATIHAEPLALGPVIAKTLDDLYAFASERQVRIVVSLPSDLPMISADPIRVGQILLNLLHNAVKFSPMGSIVNLTVTRLSVEKIKISVHDVGPGIAQDDMDKVFQPFYRAPAVHKTTKGAGLGLAIAKLLVELHQGHLWVESGLQHGTCLSFTLPSTTPAQPAVRAAIVPQASHGPIA